MKNKSVTASKNKKDLSEHRILPALTSVMRLELVVNADSSSVWLLHDAPFSGILHWMEYDAEFAAITLVMQDGSIQDLGIHVNGAIGECLVQSRQLYTILTDGQKVHDMYMVPVVIRENFRS